MAKPHFRCFLSTGHLIAEISRSGIRLCYYRLLLLMGALIVGSSALAADAVVNWETVKTRSGVEVAQAEVEGSEFKITRGTLVSRASPFDVLAVLQDVSACPSWLHKCKHGKVLKKISQDESVYYTVIDSPMLLKDRDTVVRSAIAYDEALDALRVTMTGVEHTEPLVNKRVRVLDFSGFWLIENVDDDHIRLTYQVHMDPQVGAVRAANSTLATSVLETLINVDRLANKAPYLNTPIPLRFEFLSKPEPTD